MEEGKVICPVCGKEFKSKQALGAHMYHKHREMQPQQTAPTQPQIQMQVQPQTQVQPFQPITIQPTQLSNDGTDIVLKAMEMLEDGHSPIEIMQIYKLDTIAMKRILQDYRELKMVSQLGSKSLGDVVLEIAKAFGEQIRNACSHYNDETGVCLEYSLYDIDEELRRSCPGLFKGYGGKTRYNVNNHPWVCVFCRKGLKGGEV
jgi:uncharacterized Zn finger protein (UPF0148 family)